VIYARSRRGQVVMTAAGLILGGALAGLAGNLAAERRLASSLVAALAIGVAGLGLFRLRQLVRWPANHAGFFRDRFVLVQGHHEVQARWTEMEVISLADSRPSPGLEWLAVRLTDRLTIHLQGGASFTFRPSGIGLPAPVCRDLMLRLRDQPVLRAKLPLFGTAFPNRNLNGDELIRPER
jgi:hypothetical protein